jgi:hypothetical protein
MSLDAMSQRARQTNRSTRCATGSRGGLGHVRRRKRPTSRFRSGERRTAQVRQGRLGPGCDASWAEHIPTARADRRDGALHASSRTAVVSGNDVGWASHRVAHGGGRSPRGPPAPRASRRERTIVTVAGPAEPSLSCVRCGHQIETCAFCERDECRESLCYRCVRVLLGQELPHPHGHGD